MEFKWSGDNDGAGGGGGGGSPYFIDPVDTFADLPGSAPEGTLVLVKDEDALYERRTGAWVLFIDPSEVQDQIDGLDDRLVIAEDDIIRLNDLIIAEYVNNNTKGQPNGVASLDANGLVPSAQIPPIAITDTFVVASQAAQTALTAQKGDVAVRTDLNKSYILRSEPASTFSNWQELLTPTDTVLSVNAQTGVVSLDTDDVLEGTNQYFTAERAQDAVFNAIPSSATISSVYDDAGNTLFLDVVQSGININNTSGTLSIAKGGTGQTTKTEAFDALSPTTSKGDLIVSNGTDNVRQAVGTNGYALVANSATASGLEYVPVVTNPMTTLGDTLYGASAGAPTRLAGTTSVDRKVLTQVGNGTVSAPPVWSDDIATSLAYGRVRGGNVPSNATGAAVAINMLGYTLSNTYSGITILTTATNLSNISVTPGIFLVTASGSGNKGTATDIVASLSFVSGAAGTILGNNSAKFYNTVDGGAGFSWTCLVRVTASGAIALNAVTTTANATSHMGSIAIATLG